MLEKQEHPNPKLELEMKEVEYKKGFEKWFENLKPNDLALVHISDTFPDWDKEKQKFFIRTHVGHHRENGVPLVGLRDTVHFTLNGTVVEKHGFTSTFTGADWKEKDISIISPFQLVPKNKFLDVSAHDSYILGDFEIPDGTSIVCDVSKMPILLEKGIINHEFVEQIEQVSRESENRVLGELRVGNADIKIVDFKKRNIRQINSEEMQGMGYKTWPMGSWGWNLGSHMDSGIPQKFFERYKYPISMKAHLEHWTAKLEFRFNSIRYSLLKDIDTYINMIREGRSNYAADSFVQNIEGDLTRGISVIIGRYKTDGGKNIPLRLRKIFNQELREIVSIAVDKLQAFRNSLTKKEKRDYFTVSGYPDPQTIIELGEEFLKKSERFVDTEDKPVAAGRREKIVRTASPRKNF